MNDIHHILVPIDFGEASKAAIDAGVSLGIKLGARVTLVHSLDLTPYMYADGVPFPIAELTKAAEDGLNDALKWARAKYARVDACMLQGDPVQGILAAVEQLAADLIVMGTHGRRGIAHLLLGSVAEKIVRLSPIPVLTVGAVVVPKASSAAVTTTAT